jgi:hypothetical protein
MHDLAVLAMGKSCMLLKLLMCFCVGIVKMLCIECWNHVCVIRKLFVPKNHKTWSWYMTCKGGERAGLWKFGQEVPPWENISKGHITKSLTLSQQCSTVFFRKFVTKRKWQSSIKRCSKCDNHPLEDLAKSGYKPIKKHQKIMNHFTFLATSWNL